MTALNAERDGVVVGRTGLDAVQSVLPEDIEWNAFAAFPPSVRLGVVVGQPSEPGLYSDQGESARRCEADVRTDIPKTEFTR